MGIFINDRAWNLKRAKENYDWADWHMKRAAEAAKKGDTRAYNDHVSTAKTYRAKGDEYKRDAAKSTK